MTRLFLRLWVVATVLFATSAAVHEVVIWSSWSEAEERFYLDTISGGYRAVVDRLAATPADRRDAVLAEVAARFDHPIGWATPAEAARALPVSDGSDVLYDPEVWDLALMVVPGDGRLVRFGPTPAWPAPPLWPRLLMILGLSVGFAAVLGLAVRPLDRQQRALEAAATRLADGDLDARADPHGPTPEVAAAFNRMADRTTALIAAQRALLRAVSHELRTPIARLRLGIHLMAGQADADERARRSDALDADLEELDALVGELLEAARLDSGVTPARESVRLGDVVPLLAAGLEPLHPGVAIACPTPDATLSADPRLLRRALDNLLRNAARHAHAVEVRADGDRLHVDDDGPGIPPADRARVLEPFVRLGEGPRGHGLGLAIVARIARVHGGEVQIDDGPLGGCRVTTSWPERPRA